MEVLSKILEYQDSLEDALRLESTPEEVKETKDGKKLLKWLRRRRRATNRIVKILSRF
jgi:hypothetical protein